MTMNRNHAGQIALIKTLMLVCLLLSSSAWAGTAQPLTDDPELEKKVKAITSELRCLKCQNQTIADSQAGLADDLKQIVHDMVAQGKSEEEIVKFMTDRYGEFVRYKPAFNFGTLVLWIGPFLFLIIGVFALYNVFRERKGKLSAESNVSSKIDEERLQKIIDGNK